MSSCCRQGRKTSWSLSSKIELSSVRAQELLLVLTDVNVLLFFLLIILIFCKFLEVSGLRIPQAFDGHFELCHLVAKEFLGEDTDLSSHLVIPAARPTIQILDKLMVRTTQNSAFPCGSDCACRAVFHCSPGPVLARGSECPLLCRLHNLKAASPLLQEQKLLKQAKKTPHLASQWNSAQQFALQKESTRLASFLPVTAAGEGWCNRKEIRL